MTCDGSLQILLVEDEERLRGQIVERLEAAGHVVDVAGDGRQALALGERDGLDVAVLDIGLPRLSGIEVLQRWREAGRVFPVLLLTARDNWQDKVQGLEAGADDYLVKPFHVQELLARLHALVRRAQGRFRLLLEFGPLVMDPHGRRVSVDGRSVTLTAYEFNLLHYLMLRPRQVVGKGELTEHLYRQDFERDSNVIEVFVGRLRRKLAPLAPLETVRGLGYRFNPPAAAH